jgi:magnesium chelatase accessory protein
MNMRARPPARPGDGRLTLERDGADWPLRDSSRFVEAGGLRWHVQILGEGPTLLLVHGTGASTHSWRDLAPRLARRFRVVAPDLPGHGFSDALPPRLLSLPGMARALGALSRALGPSPQIVAGHSAGAALLARMCIDGAISPRLLVSLNGAWLPFPGIAGQLFPSMAKLLFLNPLTPRVFAWSADRHAASRLLRGTGSTLDARGIDLYARLFANRFHVAGALGMMANWDLAALKRDWPRLTTPVALVAASGDTTVRPRDAEAVAKGLPNATIHRLAGAGHLAHEEKPERVAELIEALAIEAGVVAAPESLG